MYEDAKWIDEDGKHVAISVLINGERCLVPLNSQNIDYQNIMTLVDEGKLVIQPADGVE